LDKPVEVYFDKQGDNYNVTNSQLFGEASLQNDPIKAERFKTVQRNIIDAAQELSTIESEEAQQRANTIIEGVQLMNSVITGQKNKLNEREKNLLEWTKALYSEAEVEAFGRTFAPSNTISPDIPF